MMPEPLARVVNSSRLIVRGLPSIPVSAEGILPKNRSRCRPLKKASPGSRLRSLFTPLVACLFGLLLFAQASSLPIHLGLYLAGPDARPMTKGCDKKTCCTALCYLDKDGIHHCVHEPGESCKCGSSDDDLNIAPIFLSTLITLPKITSLIPDFRPVAWIATIRDSVVTHDPATPVPPPK